MEKILNWWTDISIVIIETRCSHLSSKLRRSQRSLI